MFLSLNASTGGAADDSSRLAPGRTPRSASSSSSSSSSSSAAAPDQPSLGGRAARDAKKKREQVMEVFCKAPHDFPTHQAYGDYLERAEDLVQRFIGAETAGDLQRAQADLDTERRENAARIQQEAERRREENDKRKRKLDEEPAWGCGLPSAARGAAADKLRKVDRERAARFKQLDEAKRNRLAGVGVITTDGADAGEDPETLAERQARQVARAGGFDQNFHRQRALDEMKGSMLVF